MKNNLTSADEIAEEKLLTNNLILRAQQGDLQAFDQVMIRHQRRVITLAWRMLGNKDDARDAAQEVFIRVYKNLSKVDSERDFSGWIYRITINVCRDLAKTRSRNSQLSLEEGIETGSLAEPLSTDNTESMAIYNQEQMIIARALATLTEKERAAIVLRDLEGLPGDEVARILGSSPTTVRSQISSARSKIRLFRERWLKKGALNL
ncbi:MAG: RNA polymerase sigma factor [Acidobacteria bacterium]|nr:RNA polymerase sigma factor [Acidobacteriota bacterium]